MKPKKSTTTFRLNNRFNTSLPLIQSLAEHALKHNGELSDITFTQCLSEYGKDDDDMAVMQEMMGSNKYEFKRNPDGWHVTEID